MRKSPIWDLIAKDAAAPEFDRIAAAAGHGPQPQYRFWGSRRPPERREPVRAQLSAEDGGSNVATLRLYAPIDSWGGDWGISAGEVGAALDALSAAVDTIELHINSPGGEVWEGIAIMNQLRQHPANVRAVVDGLAASAASFIAVGADETVMAPNSQLMMHDAFGAVLGPSADMRHMADLLDKVSNNIAGVYHDKAGGSLPEWRALMLAESWFNADEAVAVGLADRVAGEAAAPEDAPENRYDLSVFQHAGRTDAPVPSAGADAGTTDTDERVRAAHQRRHALNRRRATAA